MFKKEIEGVIKEFIKFRSDMGLKLSVKKAQYIWGRGVVKNLSNSLLQELESSTKVENSKIIKQKIDIAKGNLNSLIISNWVKFIGISGSTAAGFAKEQDDIDLYIVVRNNTAWIYRGILSIRNIFSHTIRTKRDGKNVKDLYCTNFIVEQRGLHLDTDMFNFHELMYLIPIYNGEYINHIYSKNIWLEEVYGLNRDLMRSRIRESNGFNPVLYILNMFAYVSQILFMIISNHQPEIKRILKNYREGKIQFFPNDYKEKVLKKN